MASGDAGRLEAPVELNAAAIVSVMNRHGVCYARSLRRADMWSLICRHGEFDLSFRPAGFDGGYAQLAGRAHRVVVDGVEVLVADLDDVIQSKELAGRPKDVRVLPALHRYQASRRSE